jgi:hypothetical protein
LNGFGKGGEIALQIGYDLSVKKIGQIDILFPSDIQDQHGSVFSDNSTLMTSRDFFREDPLMDEEEAWPGVKRGLEKPNLNLGTISAFNLIQSLIIYERLVVDGFVLANDEDSMAVAKLFPQVVKALYLTDEERIRVGDLVGHERPFLGALVSSHPELKEPDLWAARLDFDKDLFDHFERSLPARVKDADRKRNGEALTLDIPYWLARSDEHVPRTYFYAILAKAFRIPYAPHPYRCPILKVFVEKQIDAARDTILRFDRLIGQVGQELARTFSGYDIALDIPPVAQYVVHTTEHRHDLVERILEVRGTKHARDFRAWCAELQAALAAGRPGLADAQRLYAELEKACDLWSKDLRDQVAYKRRKLKISSVLKLLGVESEFEVKDPILFGGAFKHLLFLNDLVSS